MTQIVKKTALTLLIRLSMLLIVLLATLSIVFGEEKLMLTLRSAIELSLKGNLSIAEKEILFKMAGADVNTAEGEFDPALKFQLNESFRRSSSASILVTEEEKKSAYNISFGGKIKTGTAYELSWSTERLRSGPSPFVRINPYYSSSLTLSVTQPLLKGMGKSIQETNLRVAKTNVDILRLNAESKAEDIIAETANAYWNLYFAKNNFEVAGLSLKVAESLLEEVKAKIDAGVFAPVEIYKVEAEVAVRQEDLIKAKKAVFDSEDRLRAVMNIEEWQNEIVPSEVPSEPYMELPDFESALNEALQMRRDYISALAEQKNKAMLRMFYENQKLPELNMTASSGLSGLGQTHGDSLSQMRSGDDYSWLVGLTLTIPLSNKTAKGDYLRARLDEEKADINLRAVRQKIKTALREALRTVHLAQESINAARATRIASEKRLDAEQTRFRLGMTTINDVLGFQKDYLQALSSEKRAMADYAISLIELDKARGRLLEGWGKLKPE